MLARTGFQVRGSQTRKWGRWVNITAHDSGFTEIEIVGEDAPIPNQTWRMRLSVDVADKYGQSLAAALDQLNTYLRRSK